MAKLEQYDGLYHFMGFVFDVKARQDQLTASTPGVPDGYEITLEPVGEDQFRNIGGAADGSISGLAKVAGWEG